MIKRIEQWLRNLIKSELAAVESDAAKVCPHVTDEIATLRNELAAAVNALKEHTANSALMVTSEVKSHVSTEVERPIETITAHVATEITGQFEKILSATKVAAQSALADARKTLRMPCEVCHLMSWKFIVTEAGKVICGDCQLKGKS